jgi:hypothetical protein
MYYYDAVLRGEKKPHLWNSPSLVHFQAVAQAKKTNQSIKSSVNTPRIAKESQPRGTGDNERQAHNYGECC